ncbi:MAG: 4Fe-4S dicluster domain-containing protein [Canidatus Methanoxibalbensis ujae]|nr:4Fe-4S dicluster domain-containing protein [Candidatus Methanoxibalbensis ujae]MCW7078564.1 4Fe-4S dicluster domain-containing protein [Candidatus Methanoxibalbensis ujae]
MNGGGRCDMKLLVCFPSHVHGMPYTAEVILETGAKINIDRANVDAVRGELIIDVPDEKAEHVIEQFRKRGVVVRRIKRTLTLKDERCVHCGACISVCPKGVFRFDREWRIQVDEEKCVRCDVCVKACPTSALSLT